MKESKFYTYIQNSSGGSFYINEKEGIAEYVIIEATSSKKANKIAESIGIYFDGCDEGLDEGLDCDCCGDRWYSANDDDGKQCPSLYSEPIDKCGGSFGEDYCFIHYLDGRIVKFIFKENLEKV